MEGIGSDALGRLRSALGDDAVAGALSAALARRSAMARREIRDRLLTGGGRIALDGDAFAQAEANAISDAAAGAIAALVSEGPLPGGGERAERAVWAASFEAAGARLMEAHEADLPREVEQAVEEALPSLSRGGGEGLEDADADEWELADALMERHQIDYGFTEEGLLAHLVVPVGLVMAPRGGGAWREAWEWLCAAQGAALADASGDSPSRFLASVAGELSGVPEDARPLPCAMASMGFPLAARCVAAALSDRPRSSPVVRIPAASGCLVGAFDPQLGWCGPMGVELGRDLEVPGDAVALAMVESGASRGSFAGFLTPQEAGPFAGAWGGSGEEAPPRT